MKKGDIIKSERSLKPHKERRRVRSVEKRIMSKRVKEGEKARSVRECYNQEV